MCPGRNRRGNGRTSASPTARHGAPGFPPHAVCVPCPEGKPGLVTGGHLAHHASPRADRVRPVSTSPRRPPRPVRERCGHRRRVRPGRPVRRRRVPDRLRRGRDRESGRLRGAALRGRQLARGRQPRRPHRADDAPGAVSLAADHGAGRPRAQCSRHCHQCHGQRPARHREVLRRPGQEPDQPAQHHAAAKGGRRRPGHRLGQGDTVRDDRGVPAQGPGVRRARPLP